MHPDSLIATGVFHDRGKDTSLPKGVYLIRDKKNSGKMYANRAIL